MPINYYDLERFEAVKVKVSLRDQASPDRFGKQSSAKQAETEKQLKTGLMGKLLQQHSKSTK